MRTYENAVVYTGVGAVRTYEDAVVYTGVGLERTYEDAIVHRTLKHFFPKETLRKERQGREVSLPMDTFSLLKARNDDRALLRRRDRTRR